MVTGFDLTTDEAYQPVLVHFLSIPGHPVLRQRQGQRTGGKAGSWLAAQMDDFKSRAPRRCTIRSSA